MRQFLRRLGYLIWQRRAEAELAEEIEFHRAMKQKEVAEDSGVPSGQMVEAAGRALGNTTIAREDARAEWIWPCLDSVWQDAWYAVRTFRRQPGFALVVVLTLGLGIGANTAIFSAVNAILLRPLPYNDADRLVRVIENIPGEESINGAPQRTINMSVDDFPEWRRQTTTLSHMALHGRGDMTLTGRDEAVRLSGQRVSPSLFPMLGVRPLLGRWLEPTEEKPGADRVVILSHTMWQTYFGGDPAILGRPVTLDGTAYSVVGVMPRAFQPPDFWDSQAAFWIPFALTAPPNQIRRTVVTARLKDGVGVEAAAAEAETIARALRGEPPADPRPPAPGRRRIEIVPIKDELVATIRPALLVFVVAVGLVLLIACINVATLSLARATTREREMAIRLAIGASRGRVVRQLLTESTVLALCGGVVGCALAFVGTGFLSRLGHGLGRLDLARMDASGNTIPRLNEINIDASVLLYSLAITLATGLLCGLGPALRMRRLQSIPAAVARVGATAQRIGSRSGRSVMVVGQVAFTMVLLLGAGLLIRSFVKLVTVDLGYTPANVLTFQIPQPRLVFPRDVSQQPQRTAFAENVVTQLQGVAGIQSAAFTTYVPMTQGRVLLALKSTPDGRETPFRKATC